jgi:TAG lipase/steryl ester hydrolase/phospholipase A2/LPA acyltransferase
MADFLLRPPTILPIQGSNSSTQFPKRPKHVSTASQPADQTLVHTVAQKVKEAASLWRSWKDGVSVEDREKARLLEERKNLLYLRMKSVCVSRTRRGNLTTERTFS